MLSLMLFLLWVKCACETLLSALIMMMFSCDHVCGLGVGRKGVGAKRMETGWKGEWIDEMKETQHSQWNNIEWEKWKDEDRDGWKEGWQKHAPWPMWERGCRPGLPSITTLTLVSSPLPLSHTFSSIQTSVPASRLHLVSLLPSSLLL